MGCGGGSPQAQLLRVVREGEALRLDLLRRAGGRGGYLHPRAECLARFARRKGQLRSLRAAVDRAPRSTLIAQVRLVTSVSE
jgi:predicted RNA-binding protein YlxR (DUF448 family)